MGVGHKQTGQTEDFGRKVAKTKTYERQRPARETCFAVWAAFRHVGQQVEAAAGCQNLFGYL